MVWLVGQRGRPPVDRVGGKLVRRHARVAVGRRRRRHRRLGVVGLLVVVAIVHGCRRLRLVIVVIVWAPPVVMVVHALPCRQMTTIHHAGVGGDIPFQTDPASRRLGRDAVSVDRMLRRVAMGGGSPGGSEDGEDDEDDGD